jgi:formylglycine-generating enzyme required for sulfatase activity
MPAGFPEARELEGAEAKDAGAMAEYTEVIPGSEVQFKMKPLKAGSFLMGSPLDEEDREDSEGPQVEVSLDAFWIGTHEVTWDEYQLFQFKLDIQARTGGGAVATPQDSWADAVSRPTPPYVPMDFEMGVDGFPAICMTQFAARQYTKWLSHKTGRFYRLPTEAEWEYACRAGTTTAYSFGDGTDELDEHAWHFDNADDKYQKGGLKKPNPWGLYDMHGNVSEWVLDAFTKDGYGFLGEEAVHAPLNKPLELYPRTVRGGSWDDDPEMLRSAARRKSVKGWKVQDPQLPKSIWYHTNATFVGFRIVRPLKRPTPEEMSYYWEADVEKVREIQERQRHGGR